MDIFSQLMAPSAAESRFYGVAFAIVTNTKYPDGLGRVKVQLPCRGLVWRERQMC